MEKIRYISLDSVAKIEIYENSKKLNLRQIVAEKHCDYAITGVFYNSRWKPTCQLKANGKVLADDKNIYRGCAWDTGKDICSCRVPSESQNKLNHYACCALIANNGPYPNDLINYNQDVGGKRGRTGFGVSDGKLLLYASTDGADAKTPEGLRDYLWNKDKKIEWFIMGDGGGKVNFYDGNYIQGKAKSQNLILIYLQEDEQPKKISGKKIFTHFLNKNPRYYAPKTVCKIGYMQHSTGMPGAKAKTIINSWNTASAKADTEFIIDDTGIYQMMPIGVKTWHCGGSANNTHVGVEICEPEQARFIDINWYNLSYGGKNNTKYAVTALQKELDARGYDVHGIDGIFGKGLKSAVIQFQKDNKLTADGIVGKNTLHKLQNRLGTFMLYNPKENQAYFDDVYNKAVYTCAHVLDKIHCKNINNTTVLSHAEGYKQGIASNHADVGHWWKYHNKTMDDFRSDVNKYIVTGQLQTDNANIITNEANIAWNKAIKLGIFDEDNPLSNLTYRQLAVVLDRLNLLK